MGFKNVSVAAHLQDILLAGLISLFKTHPAAEQRLVTSVFLSFGSTTSEVSFMQLCFVVLKFLYGLGNIFHSSIIKPSCSIFMDGEDKE